MCRKTGHLVRDCTEVTHNSELGWFISVAREEMTFDDDLSGAPRPLCLRCASLDLLAWMNTDPPLERDQNLSDLSDDTRVFRSLGPVKDIILRDDCGLCRCLFALIPNPYPDQDELEQDVKLVLSWSMYRIEAAISMDTPAKRSTSKFVAAILDPSTTDLNIEDLVSTRGDALCAIDAILGEGERGLRARRINPYQIDLEAVRRWLSTCEKLHPVTCVSQESHGLQIICLIDVELRRIVSYSSETHSYLALSYVWGNVVQDFPGAGRVGTELGSLPQTIEDALSLAKDLGHRYLWVDSVCIDQKNEDQKLRQIEVMNKIYQGAFATIIAFSTTSISASASARERLPRVASAASSYRQMNCTINGTHLVGLGPTLSQLVWVLPWGNRAWTLQEALLSPRCIYVSRYQAQFECNAMTCYESLDESTSAVHQIRRATTFFEGENFMQKINAGVLRSPFATNMGLQSNELRVYSNLARLFSSRKLTRQSDALLAFSGILQALKVSAYPAGFHWALPLADINWALLWTGRGQALRRDGFPSWSWLSWLGEIWPGEPSSEEGPQRPHEYPFDLTIRRVTATKDIEMMFEASYQQMSSEKRQLFMNDPISNPGLQDQNSERIKYDKLGFHRPEQVIYVDSFTLRMHVSSWRQRKDVDHVDHTYFFMKVGNLNLPVLVPASSRGWIERHSQNEQIFILLTRNLVNRNWIAHNFLLLEEKGDAFERICAVKFLVPKSELAVLRLLKLRREALALI
ncbi:hypothetical protein MMC10_003668 [Thelotrema lepadinum]|nr:hypothetical protein [Thelotrema lepadinum]